MDLFHTFLHRLGHLSAIKKKKRTRNIGKFNRNRKADQNCIVMSDDPQQWITAPSPPSDLSDSSRSEASVTPAMTAEKYL